MMRARSARHHERLRSLVANAEARGGRVVALGDTPPDAADDRTFAPTLLFQPTDEMAAMQEEIFGPLLPVVTYRTLDEAIAYVNARPRPLALYYFDGDAGRQRQVLERTASGGVTFNDCIYHLVQHNLPFGGVGPSGMGHYHGFDGFATFSKKRGVMVQSRWAATDHLHAPWAPRRGLVAALLRLARR